MTRNALVALLRIMRSPKVGPITFYKLLSHYKTYDAILAAWPEIKNVGPLTPQVDAFEEIEAHENLGASFITFDDPLYPTLLRGLSDAPPLLSARGYLPLLAKNSLAIVGGRNASLSACQFASLMAEQLTNQGWTIASGFARGIDTAAHRGALCKGSIAFFAGGIDQIYPPENEKFLSRFLETGLALTEVPFGVSPMRLHFPKRNRLIAGISLGTLVIEAAFQSGSLITAQAALDLGRDVFSVPGFPLDPRNRGSNKLLKDGAHLTETAWDILNHYPHQALTDLKQAEQKGHSQKQDTERYIQLFYDGDALKTIILQALSTAPVEMDLLVESIGLGTPKVLELLSDLELEGKVQRLSGNLVALTT